MFNTWLQKGANRGKRRSIKRNGPTSLKMESFQRNIHFSASRFSVTQWDTERFLTMRTRQRRKHGCPSRLHHCAGASLILVRFGTRSGAITPSSKCTLQSEKLILLSALGHRRRFSISPFAAGLSTRRATGSFRFRAIAFFITGAAQAQTRRTFTTTN